MISVNRLFVVVIGILDDRKEKIVLIRRKRPPYQGYWSLIGGKIKKNEPIFTAAKREAMEETGMQLSNLEFHGILEEILYRQKETEVDIFHIFIVSGQTKKKELIVSEEGITDWINLSDLDKIPLIPSDKLMITEMILKHSNGLKFAKATLREELDTVKMTEFEVVSEYH